MKMQLHNQVFGNWKVLKEVPNTFDSSRNRFWKCLCTLCNIEYVVQQSNLINGKSTKCKICHNRAIHKNTLNNTSLPAYNNFQNMKARCLIEDSRDFQLYGGKGITIAEEFLNIKDFSKWAIETGWSKGLHLDRIDNTKGYSKSNCQWLTSSEHAVKTANERYGLIDVVYRNLILEVLERGSWRQGRNGRIFSSFAHTLSFEMYNTLPLLNLRKIYYKGVIGEFKSFIEDSNTIEQFKANGCPFWDMWADEEGNLKLDYPPREQLDYVINLIKNEPTSRRIIIDLWNPENIGNLSLEPCHTQYQFYVRDNEYLDIIWVQRSVDVAIGMPSDFILAGLYLLYIGKKVNLKPGRVTMNFGDTHIYEEHMKDLLKMIDRKIIYRAPRVIYNSLEDIEIINYNPQDPIKFELKA